MNLNVLAVFVFLLCGIEGSNIPLEIVIRLLGGGGFYAVHKDKEQYPRNHEFDIDANGYKYAYQVGWRFSAESAGILEKHGTKDVFRVRGKYEYVTPDATLVKVHYVADENGYRPVVHFGI